jgi:hypothetical protein
LFALKVQVLIIHAALVLQLEAELEIQAQVFD